MLLSLAAFCVFSTVCEMKIVRGDLLALAQRGEFDVIVHGCNCFNTMGAGIAKSIRRLWPAAYEADCATEKGSAEKLGTYTSATVVNDENPHRLTIVNAYTQHHWTGKEVLVDYDALRDVFRKIKLDFTGTRIAYPKIGAGLAGGDWERIKTIIDNELQGENHTLVVFDPNVNKNEQDKTN